MSPKPEDDEKKVQHIQLKEIGAAKDIANGDTDHGDVQFKVYARRWLILAVVALLNNSNTMSWISFAPVSKYCNIYYNYGKAAYWFSMAYMIVTIPVGLLAMFLGSSFGLRASILIAGWANGIGALIRLLSSFLPEEYRFPVGITGQAIAAIAYPFIMFMPTRVAGSWFGADQRGLATTIGLMSNPLGVLMANLISPAIVTAPEHIPLINILTCVLSVTAMLLATFGVNRSEPKTPPTFSAGQTQMAFIPGLVSCMKNKQFLVLFVVMGSGIGMFNTLYTFNSDLLCPSGYGNRLAALCSSLMIIGGVIGAFGSGMIVDRTKLYEETMKIAMGLAVVFGLVFMQLTLHADLSPFIAATCFLFGVFGLASYPVGLELASECSYPVTEATSTGLVVLCGQLQSVLYLFVMNKLGRQLQPSKKSLEVCTVGEDDKQNVPKDYTLSVMAFSLIASLMVLGLVFLFKPVYRRLEAERANRAREEKAKELSTMAAEERDNKIKLLSEDNPTAPLQDTAAN